MKKMRESFEFISHVSMRSGLILFSPFHISTEAIFTVNKKPEIILQLKREREGESERARERERETERERDREIGTKFIL